MLDPNEIVNGIFRFVGVCVIAAAAIGVSVGMLLGYFIF